MNNLVAKNFSFNVPGGRCEQCKGQGNVIIEMQFLSDLEVICDTCNGKRFKENILEVKLNNKNINQLVHYNF